MLFPALVLSLVSSVAFSADMFVAQGEIPQALIPALTALSKKNPNLLTVDEESIQVKTELGAVAIECDLKKRECSFDAELVDGNLRVDQIIVQALLELSEAKGMVSHYGAELSVSRGAYQTWVEVRRNPTYNRYNESVRCSASTNPGHQGIPLATCKYHVARLDNGSGADWLDKMKETEELRDRLAAFDKDKTWIWPTDPSQLSLIEFADSRRQGTKEFHFSLSRRLDYATAKHGDVTNIAFKVMIGGKREDGGVLIDSVTETINRFKKTSP